MPADNNGLVREYSSIERSPHSTAPLQVPLSQSEFDQGPISVTREHNSCGHSVLLRALLDARVNAERDVV
ncbi:MAG TPA: hypothetical protein VJ822_18450 [Dongiaceae bacterium]|nr:hypothetical protein [Dongiaceae bacterium]